VFKKTLDLLNAKLFFCLTLFNFSNPTCSTTFPRLWTSSVSPPPKKKIVKTTLHFSVLHSFSIFLIFRQKLTRYQLVIRFLETILEVICICSLTVWDCTLSPQPFLQNNWAKSWQRICYQSWDSWLDSCQPGEESILLQESADWWILTCWILSD
jgi:hypothetical protein